MRILMFGWEFPPYISGGLGTACFGITKSLKELGNEIIFVLPRIRGKREGSHVEFVSASETLFYETSPLYETLQDSLNIRAVDSLLLPYMGEDQYRKLLAEARSKRFSYAAEKGE